MTNGTPEPTITRIPKQTDGSTWRAEFGGVGAEARTKARVLEAFAEQWERFGR